MIFFYTFIIIAVCFVIFLQTYWIWSINQNRRNRRVPTKNQGTMFDVRTLLIDGDKDMAIKLYSEIFGVNHKEAKKEVEELEKNIKQE